MRACLEGHLIDHPKRASVSAGATLIAALILQSPDAYAQPLDHFISNLYGGQGITLADTPPPFPTHAHHFTEDSITELNALGGSIVSGLNLTSFPTTAVGYTYDIQLGLPVSSAGSLGPILGERAETLGAGKLNLAATYNRVDFTNFNGQSLNHIKLLLPHAPIPGCTLANCDFLADQIQLNVKLDISQDVFAIYTTYGITENWDVSFILPVVHTHAMATSDATIIFNSASGPGVHSFVGAETSPHSVSGGDATGIGDIILHTKYNFLRDNPSLPDLAVAGQLRVPSGDKSNLLGTGSTNLLGLLILSKQIDWYAPHLNIGYEGAFGGLDKSNLRYAVGGDFRIDPTLTTAVDFVGRKFTGGQQLHDVGLGAKWNPVGASVFSVNFLLPINRNDGLRPDYVASVGYQITF
jgi:Putative MetA-pathway of phenol degradation